MFFHGTLIVLIVWDYFTDQNMLLFRNKRYEPQSVKTTLNDEVVKI